VKYFVRSILLSLTLFATSAHAVVLQINSSGVLVGTTGIDVIGKLYGASHQDGACETNYSEKCHPALSIFRLENLAPASLILLGLGMVGVSIAGRRRS